MVVELLEKGKTSAKIFSSNTTGVRSSLGTEAACENRGVLSIFVFV